MALNQHFAAVTVLSCAANTDEEDDMTTTKVLEPRERITNAMLDEMLGDELLMEMRRKLVERILDPEMEVHLDCDKERVTAITPRPCSAIRVR